MSQFAFLKPEFADLYGQASLAAAAFPLNATYEVACPVFVRVCVARRTPQE